MAPTNEILERDLTDAEIAVFENEALILESDGRESFNMNDEQRAAYYSEANTILVVGGNQSGKSLLATHLTVDFALGIHPRAPKENRVIWYCTTTFKKFSEQMWKHLKRQLFFEDESCFKLPTRRVLGIHWQTQTPELPDFIQVRGEDGFTTDIVIHSYDQGAGEFQAATLNMAVIDEECPELVINSVRARFLAKQGIILVAATPEIGVEWLKKETDLANAGSKFVSLYRLKTLDNPGVNLSMVEEMQEKYKNDPDELRLRLEGWPYASTGLVYALKAANVCAPFYLDPGSWCFRRCVDHGFNNCAALWIATHKSGDDLIVYRDYLGQQRTIRENAGYISAAGESGGRLTGGAERYVESWIDPATLGTDAETGIKVIDLWRKAGLKVLPAPDNRVLPGIERVKELLNQPGGPDGKRPRLRIFSTCVHLIREMQNYRWKDTESDEAGKDDKKENPVKTMDHECDNLRYLCSAGLRWIDPPPPKLDLDPVQRAFYNMRHKPNPAKF